MEKRPLNGCLSVCNFRLMMAVWRSGNVVGCFSEVTVRWARSVLGWVTVFGRQTTSVFHQATQANSASYPQWEGEMSTSQSAVMLCGWGVKTGMVHSTCG